MLRLVELDSGGGPLLGTAQAGARERDVAGRLARAPAGRPPRSAVVFADTRAFAEDWTCRFLDAATYATVSAEG